MQVDAAAIASEQRRLRLWLALAAHRAIRHDAAVIEALYDQRPTVTLQARVTYESGEVGVSERTLTLQEV